MEQKLLWQHARKNTRDLIDHEEARIVALKSKLHMWKMRKGQTMKQYSKRRNLMDRDNNTMFFHACATLKKKQNSITSIKIGDQVLSTTHEIKQGILNHFKDTVAQEDLPRITLPFGAFKQLPQATSQHLEVIPSSD